ncbi:MAG: DNA circularization N-terminal domain-containing protein [Paraburkholderia sp.]|uniref:DNA circularization N-terminal domain-containing protein n=1 Tax=Burkholderiaceae TaxID=119060 RepID=UPI001484D266|nr:DNA circularization N-terminal domain-containing protein [Burkholderia sp. 4M9327F10]
MSYWDDLQQASFNGVPFGVEAEGGKFGRRWAKHEYPKRDTAWMEDLGRRTREHPIVGFLLENDQVYGGGPVIQQKLQMIAAVETEGLGQLIHPSLGTLTVAVTNCEFITRWDQGLIYEIHFEFVESGLQQFPGIDTSTLDAVTAAALAADGAASTDFVTRAESALEQGAAVVKQAASTASLWAAQAQGLVNDARNVYKFVYGLQGPYGRYFGGRLNGFNPSAALQTVQQAGVTVTSLMAQGTVLRAAVTSAGNTLSNVASELGI